MLTFDQKVYLILHSWLENFTTHITILEMEEDVYKYSSDGSSVTLESLPWDEIQPRRGHCVIVTNSKLRWRKYTCSGTRYSRFHTICELQIADPRSHFEKFFSQFKASWANIFYVNKLPTDGATITKYIFCAMGHTWINPWISP